MGSLMRLSRRRSDRCGDGLDGRLLLIQLLNIWMISAAELKERIQVDDCIPLHSSQDISKQDKYMVK